MSALECAPRVVINEHIFATTAAPTSRTPADPPTRSVLSPSDHTTPPQTPQGGRTVRLDIITRNVFDPHQFYLAQAHQQLAHARRIQSPQGSSHLGCRLQHPIMEDPTPRSVDLRLPTHFRRASNTCCQRSSNGFFVVQIRETPSHGCRNAHTIILYCDDNVIPVLFYEYIARGFRPLQYIQTQLSYNGFQGCQDRYGRRERT